MAFLIVGLMLSVILANVSGAINEHQSKQKLCGHRYSVTCLKMDLVSFLERISDRNEYNLLSGVSVVRDGEVNVTKTAEIIAEVSRIFPSDPNKRLDEFLIVKLNDYLKSHSLRLKLMDNEAISKARELFQGRKGGGGKLGKKGGLETMIAAAMMMKGTLGAIALGTLAMLAGKALMTGLLAMTLASIVGLKSLTGSGGGHKSTTYEIVAKPMYTHSHSEQEEMSHGHGGGGGGYGGGWGRSQRTEMPQYMAHDRV